ncbi:MAG TPA: HD domain-containing phosphohydrolase [Xanthomonadaceae bacterium]|nr:HD domain-containing phosphohydrolase [Xanthomonadaceae bacterium]
MDTIARFVEGVVEGRDPDLAGHLDRLGEAANEFSSRLGLSREESELLEMGARLHDIGKLSISESILNKPGRLTATEFSLVKQHAAIGFLLLTPLDLDPRINEIVHFHHENFDGTGYPQGLSGDGIPLLARVVRILDTFDAVTDDRPYKKGASKAQALQILQSEARLYDPELLNAFVELRTAGT